MTLNDLQGIHQNETGYIIGRGPSILSLTASDFGPGPIIALNYAIHTIRKLGLPNVVYTMQKDKPMVEPIAPERLILSQHESATGWSSYPDRYVVDVQRDFYMRWFTPSAPVAVRIAHVMGCSEVVMIGHDAHTRADGRRVDENGRRAERANDNYAENGKQAMLAARAVGLKQVWR